MKKLSNTYLDSKGLHTGRPPGCQVSGSIVLIINDEWVEVQRCGRAVPRRKGYRITKRRRKQKTNKKGCRPPSKLNRK